MGLLVQHARLALLCSEKEMCEALLDTSRASEGHKAYCVWCRASDLERKMAIAIAEADSD